MPAESPVTLTVATLADVEAIHHVVRAAEVADALPLVTPIVDIEEWFAHTHGEESDEVMVATIGDEVVGYVRVDHVPSGAGLERAHIWCDVLPARRGLGVGTAMVEWGVQAARRRLIAQPVDIPLFIRCMVWEWRSDAAELVSNHGFRPVRWFRDMLRTLGQLPTIDGPTGMSIVPWDVARSEELRLVKNSAFADHWGSTPSSPTSWDAQTSSYGTRPDLSFMAVDDQSGAIVGLSLNAHYPGDEEVTGRRDGWLNTIATLREHRGRGVASALIAASLHRFADAGMTHASLAVDADNPSGAFGLYSALGFEPTHQLVCFQIEVARPEAVGAAAI